MLQLKQITADRICFHSLCRFHEAYLRCTDKEQIQKLESNYFHHYYNIKTIYVDSYKEIDDFLKHLYAAYKKKNVFISGSFRDFTSEKEDRANNLCKALVNKLIDNGYNIYTGDGKRLGSYIISNATKKLAQNSAMYMQERLKIMPYIDHTFKGKSADDPERVKYIQEMIKDCSTSIFMYGQYKDDEYSKGVYEEYIQSNRNGLKIIPVASTGYAAQKILENMESNYVVPGYLEKYTEALKDTNKEVVQVVDIIIEILNNIHNNPT